MMFRNACTKALIATTAMTALAIGSAPLSAEVITTEEVIVVAPGHAGNYERHIGSHRAGLNAEVNATVNYSDLDLRFVADVQELKRRIKDGASMACESLADSHPFGKPKQAKCIQRAYDEAMVDVNRLVDQVIQESELIAW
ncbi:UrcA family protein [Elongatibacter sediminis]|uniref:UrcA family protein n=1 Tax=Elongatibacter sediminis TaxID=3119006 RepID=A0AAW9RAN5_9GAMM